MFENILTSAIKINNKKYFQRLIGTSHQRLNDTREKRVSIEGINLTQSNKAKKYLLYVHIPFCEKICPYCSFNRYEFDPSLAAKYFSSLRRELKIYHDYGYDCDSVYVGGGTPTIALDELSRTIDLIKQLYSVGDISIETNPNHLTRENIKVLKQLKVNRISVGVQSFDDSILKQIKRYQAYGSGDEIKEKLKSALDDSYTLNVDMIFNFPSQTMQMLEYDIDCLCQIKPDQVTFYPLMPSEGISDTLSGYQGKSNYSRERRFYFEILDRLSAYWEPLTAWCFGKNKNMVDEYIINRSEYIGLGSGSFGLLNGYIYANAFSPEQYINKLQRGLLPVVFSKRFSRKELVRYGFLMQLFGMNLDIDKFSDEYSGDFLKVIWKEIAFLKMIGGIERKNGHISLTRRGMYYWVIAMKEFFISVNNFREHCRSVNYN